MFFFYVMRVLDGNIRTGTDAVVFLAFRTLVKPSCLLEREQETRLTTHGRYGIWRHVRVNG